MGKVTLMRFFQKMREERGGGLQCNKAILLDSLQSDPYAFSKNAERLLNHPPLFPKFVSTFLDVLASHVFKLSGSK